MGVGYYDSNSDAETRRTILNGLYVREAVMKAETRTSFSPLDSYKLSYQWFDHPHSEINNFAELGYDVDALWAIVRPRILAGKEAWFDEAMKRLIQKE